MSKYEAEPAASEMRFDPAFEQPVDDRKTILRSSDGLHFYFRLSFLSELSSFFRDLPLMKAEEIIELPHASGDGLSACLRILRAFAGPDALPRIPRSQIGKTIADMVTICDAYDLQCVLVQLGRCQASILDLDSTNPGARAFLDYALAAVRNDVEAAKATSRLTLSENIVSAPKWISDILYRSCPLYLIRLHELHSLHFHRRHNFLEDLADPQTVQTDEGRNWPTECNPNSCPNFKRSSGDWPGFRRTVITKIADESVLDAGAGPLMAGLWRVAKSLKCERCEHHMVYVFDRRIIESYVTNIPRAIERP